MTEAEWLACTDPKPGVTVAPSFVPHKKNRGGTVSVSAAR